MNVNDIDKKDCCGCALCANICVKRCISMNADEEGFLVPRIDLENCINCGLCYKKCPINDLIVKDIEPIYFATAIKDKEKLLNSSSGGLFIAFAEYVISEGGFVCGCVYDEKMVATHICTNSLSEIKKMMGSKYVQSSIYKVLPQIKEKLSQGYKVLFTGTACQIASVKNFVNNHENLLLVDILCHGVPSPLFFKKYVEFLEKKHNGKIVNVEFRNKKKLGWGSEHRTYYEFEKNNIIHGRYPSLPAYFCSFFYGTNLRESCYRCRYAGRNRISDITIGDFWGYYAYYKRNFPEGISIASVNTAKGLQLFDSIKSYFSICDRLSEDTAKGTNTNFYYPTKRPKSRSEFYKGIKEKKYKDYIWKIYLDINTRKKFLVSVYGRFMPNWVKEIRRKINK